jgi:hypothetical protein
MIEYQFGLFVISNASYPPKFLTPPDYVDVRRPPSEAAMSRLCSQLS